MKALTLLFGLSIVHTLPALLSSALAAPESADLTPIQCDDCAKWNAEHKPFRIYGNTYYVGPEGLSSVLITSPAGHILIDGALPQSAPQIAAHIRALGFRLQDIRYILNSHAHFDHAGGIAALQRMSGAKVAASRKGALALHAGDAPANDPQVGFGSANRFPTVPEVSGFSDGDELKIGPLRITIHDTPGHTPGSASYTWQSCKGNRCLRMVYADSLNSVSAPGYRFSADPAYLFNFRVSISTVRSFPCDILISAHPGFSHLFERLAARSSPGGADSLRSPHACQNYADDALRRLEDRLREEQRGP